VSLEGDTNTQNNDLATILVKMQAMSTTIERQNGIIAAQSKRLVDFAELFDVINARLERQQEQIDSLTRFWMTEDQSLSARTI